MNAHDRNDAGGSSRQALWVLLPGRRLSFSVCAADGEVRTSAVWLARRCGGAIRKAGLVSGPGPAVPLDLRRPPAQAPFNCAGGPLSNAQNERREITPRKVGSLILSRRPSRSVLLPAAGLTGEGQAGRHPIPGLRLRRPRFHLLDWSLEDHDLCRRIGASLVVVDEASARRSEGRNAVRPKPALPSSALRK